VRAINCAGRLQLIEGMPADFGGGMPVDFSGGMWVDFGGTKRRR
jgi:hypothetical protein